MEESVNEPTLYECYYCLREDVDELDHRTCEYHGLELCKDCFDGHLGRYHK